MARNMSFSLTTQQIQNRTKTVTRRKGWALLRPGNRVWACRKCMGLHPGERVERIALLEVVSVRSEPLNAIDDDLWGVVTMDDKLLAAKESKSEADHVAWLLPFCTVRRIRWETIDDKKGTDQ